jgi:4-hydroxybenzoate polyprenyltransferase
LLPVYAWVGSVGRLPASFGPLILAAVFAGAALALANQVADLERDVAAGVQTAATRLGAARAWSLAAALHLLVAVIAIGSLVLLGGRGVGLIAVVGGLAVIAIGIAVGRGARPRMRERAWELQAAGLGLLAAGWVAAVTEGGSL